MRAPYIEHLARRNVLTFLHSCVQHENMKQVTPQNPYDFLNPDEMAAVDEFVSLLIVECQRRGERVANVLNRAIPQEFIKRSRGVLERPLVRAAIAEKLQDAANAQDVSPSRLIREHAALAFSNMADFIKFDVFGALIFDLKNVSREKMAAVKSITIEDTPSGRRIKFMLHDKQPSLTALQSVMNMPQISEPARAGAARSVEKDANAEKAYAALLESMRVTT